jgi:Rrf2 family protein
MFRFSKKMMYAIEAVADIAKNDSGRPVQSRDLAQRYNISARYLEQVMQRLVHAGILTGVRGPKGGYRLRKKTAEVSVADIVVVIRQLDKSGESALDNAVGDAGSSVILPKLRTLDDYLMEELRAITLEKLCEGAPVATKEKIPG